MTDRARIDAIVSTIVTVSAPDAADRPPITPGDDLDSGSVEDDRPAGNALSLPALFDIGAADGLAAVSEPPRQRSGTVLGQCDDAGAAMGPVAPAPDQTVGSSCPAITGVTPDSGASNAAAPADTPPEITAYGVVVATGQSIAAASMFSASDPDGDSIVQYAFADLGGNGGYFTLDGVREPEQQWIVVPAGSLGAVDFVGGPAPGGDTLCVSAFDGRSWSASVGTVAATSVGGAVPIVSAHDIVLPAGQSIAAESMFSASSPAGRAITEYGFEVGGGIGYFSDHGAPLPWGQWVIISASDFDLLNFVGGGGGGPVSVAAFDGSNWSAVVTPRVDGTPQGGTLDLVVTPRPFGSIGLNQSIPVSTMFTAASQFEAPIAEYAFHDLGGDGGHFAVNGTAQPDAQWVFVPAASLGSVTYVGGSIPGNETVCISDSDGRQWSSSAAALTVSSVDIPGPFVTPGTATVLINQSIAASSMFTAGDPTGSIVQYGFQDLGGSGGYFTLNGVPQPGQQQLTVAASDLNRVSYVGGPSAGTETLNIVAYDSSTFSSAPVVAAIIGNGPAIATRDIAVGIGQTIAASSMFSASGGTVAAYAFEDLGGAGGHFAVAGVAQPDQQWIFAAAGDLASVAYVGGPAAGSETLCISASTGAGWSSSAGVLTATTLASAAGTDFGFADVSAPTAGAASPPPSSSVSIVSPGQNGAMLVPSLWTMPPADPALGANPALC